MGLTVGDEVPSTKHLDLSPAENGGPRRKRQELVHQEASWDELIARSSAPARGSEAA